MIEHHAQLASPPGDAPTISPVHVVAPPWMAEAERQWKLARERFLALVSAEQQAAVSERVDDYNPRGAGLRNWISAVAWRQSILPAVLPRELLQPYLDDPQARPLHECADCGVPIPIRPAVRQGSTVVPERIYFASCPACGGKTGWYVFRSKTFGPDIQRQPPREAG